MQLLYLQSEESPGLKQYIENKKYLSHEIIHKQMGLTANNILRVILLKLEKLGCMPYLVVKHQMLA